MTTFLKIDASILGDASVSRQLTARLQERLAGPDDRVIARDLGAGLPAIDGAWMSAIYTPAENRTPEQAETTRLAETLLEELRAADTLIIGLPVYNFGIPAALKTWFDLLARKGETFRYTQAGPEGLLTGKRAIIALSSGGTELGGPVDFASGYVRHMLGFFGITDVTFVAADQMAVDADAALARAHQAVDALAA
tara:strand:- start:37 stop:621 length:585 start_codon:yes stop_codon:yes gene_type:complete